ncbi:MAG: FHA domain-containing protein [Bdellovibrionia bacterium]
MYKLTVISGPNQGTTYAVQEGELAIGRQAGNAVVLPSSKVSKIHCTLTVTGDEVILKDQGSSNGTFVNGTLTKFRKIKEGDRISVGEYVFELSKPVKKAVKPMALPKKIRSQFQSPPAMGGSGFPNPPGGMSGIPGMGSGAEMSQLEGPPKDLRGKIAWAFDHQFMPIFYSLNLKYEWRAIAVGMFLMFSFLNLTVSVYPLLESSHQAIIKETGRRALFMARQIADQNAPFLANRMETKSEIGIIENADGVRTAMLVDLDNRIIAPSAKLNQYLASGAEAAVAIKARDSFRSGRETGYWIEADESTLVAVEPVKVLSPTAGRNVVVAMAIVSIDSSLATPEMGELGVIYSEILAITAIILGFIFLILYRMTLKPFQVLNEDIDRALKGDMNQVTHEFKIEELNPLWDIINSAIQRVSRNNSPESSSNSGESTEAFVGPLRMIGNLVKFGFLIFDSERKIVFINSIFEEMSGIRSESAMGQDISSVARDQAMGSMTNDLLGRVSTGGEGLVEDFDFSGVGCKIYMAGFGSEGNAPKCFVMAAVKVD